MRDCRLVISVRNDKVDFEGENVSVEDLAVIAGFLQVFVGQEGLARGGRGLVTVSFISSVVLYKVYKNLS